MTTQPHNDVNRRHDFVILFDVQDGNPNGDPDAGNQPRMDPETMQGIVTDVSLKRKVRDYVDVARGDEFRYKIYVQRETYLTETRGRVFDERRGRHRRTHAETSTALDVRTVLRRPYVRRRDGHAGAQRRPSTRPGATDIFPFDRSDPGNGLHHRQGRLGWTLHKS